MATQISKKRKFVADDGVCYAEHNEILTREVAEEDGYTAPCLSEISKEAIRMSVASKRWEHVWKKLPHLLLNTRRRKSMKNLGLSDDSNQDAELTRVINNHYGHLESCKITHYSNKGVHGLLKKWIQKIENSKLKFLEMYTINGIDKVIVSAPSLDILVARDIFCGQCEFLIQSPSLQFNTKLVGHTDWLHIMYNISKEENNWHEHLMNRIGELTSQKYSTLTVAVDLMSETEVERLRQLLCLCIWSYPLNFFEIRFEITFKGNNAPSHNEEIECWQKKLWVENDQEDPFPDAIFRVNCVVIYNFRGTKEEIAFVSCLIRQGKVRNKIQINSKSCSANNRSNIEAAVVKLQDLQSEDQEEKVTIEYYFRD